MKELKESDLEIGDILIFEDFDFDEDKLDKHWNKNGFEGAFDYLVHYLIAWFDPGKEGDNYKNIYHAGIWGNVNINRGKKNPLYKNCVVQAGGNGIGAASLKAMLEDETVMNIYVCRLKKKTPNFQEDINVAIRSFYAEKGQYSDTTAWLLAVICSLRYSKGILHELLVDYFKLEKSADFVVEMILFLINQYNNKHQREMIACSPLVAMMYKNAGYEIPVKTFELLNNKLPKANFDITGFLKKLPFSLEKKTEELTAIQQTVVTPRQLMESPAVDIIGVLRHQIKQ